MSNNSSPMASATDYRKTIDIQATPEAVFSAIATVEGVNGWWTRATGSADRGGQLEFWFGSDDHLVVTVEEAARPSTVCWVVTECDFLPDWVGTRPTFTLTPLANDATRLHFRHHGLSQELDCIEMCTRGWDHFIPSLGQYVETGTGNPVGSAAERARRLPT